MNYNHQLKQFNAADQMRCNLRRSLCNGRGFAHHVLVGQKNVNKRAKLTLQLQIEDVFVVVLVGCYTIYCKL